MRGTAAAGVVGFDLEGTRVAMTPLAASRNPLGVSTCVFRAFTPGDLEHLTHQGITQLELSTECYDRLRDPASFRELAAALAGAGIAVNSIHVPFYQDGFLTISDPDPRTRQMAMDMARLCLERLDDLGGRCLVIHPSAEPIADGERAGRVAQCVESLRALAALPGAAPARIAVECLPRTCLGHDAGELLGILDAVGKGALGVCVDVNHANLREDVVGATRRYGARILTLHISDNDGLDERHWLPGQGIIPWQEWLGTLVATGYRGPLLYEVNAAPADGGPDADAQHLDAICRNATEVLGVGG